MSTGLSRTSLIALVSKYGDPEDQAIVSSLTGAGFDISMFDSGLPDQDISLSSFDIVMLSIGGCLDLFHAWMRRLRAASPAGIAVISDDTSPQMHAHALNSGADIYAIRPIDTEILVLNLLSLIRRLQTREVKSAPLSSWMLRDDGWRIISPEGKGVALTLPERLLLRQLLAAESATLSREMLLDAFAENSISLDTRRLDSLVHRLRRKTASLSKDPFPLVTMRGMGYRFGSPAFP